MNKPKRKNTTVKVNIHFQIIAPLGWLGFIVRPRLYIFGILKLVVSSGYALL